MWECSVDLAQYLLLNDSIDKTGMSPPGAVLELGCGKRFIIQLILFSIFKH